MREKIWFNRAPSDVGSASADPSSDTAGTDTGASASNGSGGGSDSGWFAALDTDTRRTVEAKGWLAKSANEAAPEIAKSYAHLQREYSTARANSLSVPDKNAPAERWDEFYGKLGRPEKPDGYEFQLPSDLPEHVPYDRTLSLSAKEWAYQAGLNPQQAQLLHDNFAKYQATQYEKMAQQHVDTLKQADEVLQKEWGGKDSPTFERNIELAQRTIRKLGGDGLKAELKGIGALDANGKVLTPKLALLLANVGQNLYADDAVYGGGADMPNPFAAGPHENMTKQGEILERDPELAKALMRSAGIDPKEYNLK